MGWHKHAWRIFFMFNTNLSRMASTWSARPVRWSEKIKESNKYYVTGTEGQYFQKCVYGHRNWQSQLITKIINDVIVLLGQLCLAMCLAVFQIVARQLLPLFWFLVRKKWLEYWNMLHFEIITLNNARYTVQLCQKYHLNYHYIHTLTGKGHVHIVKIVKQLMLD